MTKRTKSYAIKPKQPRSAAYFFREIGLLRIQVTELERRLRGNRGEAAFAAYEDAVAAAVEREIKPDMSNVVRLR